jgi:purine-binding chemotaxis protein CheW
MEKGFQSLNDVSQVVVFGLEEQRYALRLFAVQQIVRMAEITPLPQAPGIILGVIDIRGEIVPVFDIRRRFQLPEREISVSDHLLIARTSERTVALAVDQVFGVTTLNPGMTTEPDRILPGLAYVEGVVKLEDGLVFIHDLDTFLSTEETATLERALASV